MISLVPGRSQPIRNPDATRLFAHCRNPSAHTRGREVGARPRRERKTGDDPATPSLSPRRPPCRPKRPPPRPSRRPPRRRGAEAPPAEANPAEAPAKSAPDVDAAADALGKVGVSEAADAEKPDEPDLALKSEVLNEQQETVVEKKVVDDTPYASAKTFEDLGLSAELLKGLYSEMKFERPSKIQGETLP